MSGSVYDADTGLPKLKIGGRIYTGRHLSMQELERFEPAIIAMIRDPERQTPRAVRALVYRFFSQLFPAPWWRVWEASVGWRVVRQPLKKQLLMLMDFFGEQWVENFGARHPLYPTNGSN